MPVVTTQRKYVSEVVTGRNPSDNTNAMEFNVKTISLTNGNDANNASPGTVSTAAVDVIGVPVIFALDNAGTAGSWVIYNDNDGATELAASIAATAVKSGLPNNAKLGVVVGSNTYGKNDADVTLDANGETVTVLYRGANNTGVLQAGLDYTAGGVSTSAANQTAFEEQLESQGIMVVEAAETVSPTYTS